MTPALELDGMGLRFGKGPERLADISLSVAPGAVTTLSGPAGAGKSLLLEVAALLRRPSRGRVRLFGQDGAVLRPEALARLRRRLSLIEAAPVPDRMLDPVIAAGLPLRLAGMDEASARTRAGEMLAWIRGEAGVGDRSTLARDVALARAVIAGPELVLIDELAGFPEARQRRIAQLVAQLSRQGVAFVIASRDEQALAGLPATTRCRMSDGLLHRTAKLG